MPRPAPGPLPVPQGWARRRCGEAVPLPAGVWPRPHAGSAGRAGGRPAARPAPALGTEAPPERRVQAHLRRLRPGAGDLDLDAAAGLAAAAVLDREGELARRPGRRVLGIEGQRAPMPLSSSRSPGSSPHLALPQPAALGHRPDAQGDGVAVRVADGGQGRAGWRRPRTRCARRRWADGSRGHHRDRHALPSPSRRGRRSPSSRSCRPRHAGFRPA